MLTNVLTQNGFIEKYKEFKYNDKGKEAVLTVYSIQDLFKGGKENESDEFVRPNILMGLDQTRGGLFFYNLDNLIGLRPQDLQKSPAQFKSLPTFFRLRESPITLHKSYEFEVDVSIEAALLLMAQLKFKLSYEQKLLQETID